MGQGSWRAVRGAAAAAALSVVSSAPALADGPSGKYDFPAGTIRVLDGRELGRCLASTTRELSPHWSIDRSSMDHPYHSIAFFRYLVATPDRPYDYATGQEPALKRWVMSRPNDSIDPQSIYAESLALNHGNVWNAVLTIHQLLREHARWNDNSCFHPPWSHRIKYTFLSSPGEAGAFFDKFVDIRGDLSERGPGFRGDHAGSWYRLWGMMLYRMMNADPDRFQHQDGTCQWVTPTADRVDGLGRLIAGLNAALTSQLAERLKTLTGKPEADRRKTEINWDGGVAGGALLDALQDGTRPAGDCSTSDVIRPGR